MISHRFWQARFASSPAAIGATVLVDGQPSQIVGVLPASLADAGFPADVWEPHTLFADWEARRAAIGRGSWFVFGRLRADANVETAQRELGAIARRLDVGQPDADAGRTVRVVSLREQLAGARPSAVAWTLAGATALLWLVAAVNVAGLTIARGLGRLPQLAIQAALGASRGRLVRSLLVESGVVAVLAGIGGLAVAAAATGAIRVFGPDYAARLGDVRLDVRVLAWAIAVSALTGIVIGLMPAIAAWRRDLRVDGGRTTASGAASRVRRLFVAAECATAVVLLAGGGLFLRSWWNVSRVDPGFQADRVLALHLATPAGLPVAQRAAFYEAVLDRVGGVPGIERAGISSELFVGTVREQPIVAEGGERAGTQLMPLRRDEIAGDVFDTLGTRLLGGRAFTLRRWARPGPGRDRQRGDGQPAVARPRRRRPALRARPARSRRAVVHRRRRRRRHAPPGPRDRAGAADVRAGRAGAVEGHDPLRAHVDRRGRRASSGSAGPGRRAARRGAQRRRQGRGLRRAAWSAIGSAPSSASAACRPRCS